MAEQLLNGRYRLLRPLGTGGMASVYLAEDLRLGRRVAVKILHPQFAADPAFVARFEQEARIAAALSHPNIVQIYDVGHDGDRRYIVMEYIEGETLKELIGRQGALPVPRALAVISGVLAALDFAHHHNLIHRDIKAQNILLTPDGDVKVTDFGIARELSGGAAPTLTAAGMVIGTVQYFSPEQAQGRPATPQSDVYSAGVVLFEMLTGKLPFEADNPLAVAMQQINQAPPRPTRLNAVIPPAVEAIVLKAMAKNPAERFGDAAAMKSAVDGARANAAQTTRVAPPPPPAVTPGAPRLPTRPTPSVTVRQAPPPPPRRRSWWLLLVAVVAILAVVLGAFFASGHGIFGFGGSPTATPVPSMTPTDTPAPTKTPAPTATKRPIVVPHPTATGTATDTPTDTPTDTDTPAPSATPTDTPTDTDTPAPSATPTNTPTDTPGPSSTPTGTPTATPAPSATPTNTPTDTPTPGLAAIQLNPQTASPGSVIGVSGSGWPDGDTVTLSVDFGSGAQTVGRPTVTDGAFTATFVVPPDTTPAGYIVNAQDDQSGESASANLTVNSSG